MSLHTVATFSVAACGTPRLSRLLLPRWLHRAVTGVYLRGPISLLRHTSLINHSRTSGGLSATAACHRSLHYHSSVRSGSSTSSSSASPSTDRQLGCKSIKKKLVFCGTPEVAANVLQRLLAAANDSDASFEVAAVVTQPPRPTGRSNRKKPQPSPVQALAEKAGLPPEGILAPEKPGDPTFLATLQNLAPDLCVTAAYGNYLPSRFLAIPACGTLNIHPSLLPRYRGAAPVQRSLQDGVTVSGVTVLYTVRAMDAGPILAQQQVPIDPDIQAPELLTSLFELGTDLLLSNLDAVWAGRGPLVAQAQDEAAATHAAKLTREEAVLDFGQPALVCHNKVRGFAGWPGTFATFQQTEAGSTDSGSAVPLELKIVRTRVAEPAAWCGGSEHEVKATKDGLYVRCGDGSILQVLEVQAPGKRVMSARDFMNGLKGRTLHWQPVQQPVGLAV